jgi:hypothetical protein
VKNSAVADQHQKFQETAQMLAATLENKPFDDERFAKNRRSGKSDAARSNRKKRRNRSPFMKKILTLRRKRATRNNDARANPQRRIRRAGFARRKRLRRGLCTNFPTVEDYSLCRICSPKKTSVKWLTIRSSNSIIKKKQSEVRQIGLFNARRSDVFADFRVELDGALHRARLDRSDQSAGGRRGRNRARKFRSSRRSALAEDELALLVESFNQMSAKLEENSAELEERRRYIETVLQSLSTGVISFDAKIA